MKIARPTIAEERWLQLAACYPALRPAIDHSAKGGDWKTTTWLGRCLGFILGLLGISLLGAVLSPFPAPLLIGGLVLVAAAEWLVAQRRVFRSGVEEALYLCGAMALGAQLLTWSTGHNDALAVAFIAAAVLLAGWRLLNPMFTTLAAAGCSLAIALINTHFLDGRMRTLEAAIACAVLAVLALIAAGRQWQRPAHDAMLDGLVIVMPWLAYGWLVAYGWNGAANHAALALALGFLIVNMFVAVKRRQHAPLIGAMGNCVCVAYSLHALLRWPLQWELIAAGGALLLLAVLIERRLRNRLEGITSATLAPTGLDLAQWAGAASLAPAPAVAPGGMQGQGGGFGGGGASGRF